MLQSNLWRHYFIKFRKNLASINQTLRPLAFRWTEVILELFVQFRCLIRESSTIQNWENYYFRLKWMKPSFTKWDRSTAQEKIKTENENESLLLNYNSWMSVSDHFVYLQLVAMRWPVTFVTPSIKKNWRDSNAKFAWPSSLLIDFDFHAWKSMHQFLAPSFRINWKNIFLFFQENFLWISKILNLCSLDKREWISRLMKMKVIKLKLLWEKKWYSHRPK